MREKPALSSSRPIPILCVGKDHDASHFLTGMFHGLRPASVSPIFPKIIQRSFGSGDFNVGGLSSKEARSTFAKAEPDVCGLRLYMEAHNARARAAYECLGLKQTEYQVFEMDFVLGASL